MLQEIIVYIILAVVAGLVIYSLIRRFGSRKSSPCDGCSGCDLKDIAVKKGNKPPCGCDPKDVTTEKDSHSSCGCG